MTESSLPPLLILAPSPAALVELGGISLLERLRRIALQFGYREAIILSNSVESIAPHIAKPSWHGADVSLKLHEWAAAQVTIGDILDCLNAETRALLLFADFYYDGRLVRALAESRVDSVLVDSSPPSNSNPLWKDFNVHSFGRGPAAASVVAQMAFGKSVVIVR